MSRLRLATVALLLAGATALPADAQNSRLPGAVRDAQAAAETRERITVREDRREQRREDRGEQPGGRTGIVSDGRRDDRQARRSDRRDDRRDWRDDRRDDRRDWRADRRDDRRDWRDDRRDDRRDWRHDRRDDRRDYYVRHDDRRWNGYRWQPQYRYRAPVRYVYPRGYAPYQWRVGHRLPRHYYERNYYVDYRAYQLPPPPYGYHWIRVDHDVVLVALATGLIRDVLYGLYY
ncbi:MAG TPA: RcnB family protein [Arenimonas sp.]|uniref:RcnB family protein n=1 Tax=Arenimonas sp. TaxID=1872635 RepID=UPI002D8091FD|nr:RcnB family protein [Arenimonas sp.]HEU0152256.1 RcnB family protein [Arenimonas sp.]